MLSAAMVIFLSCLVIGSLVGVLAGMLGIGGGLIIVPSLVYLLTHHLSLSVDIAMPMAVATSLATIIFTGSSSARTHFLLGNINHHLFIWCGVGVMCGAIGGAALATVLSGIWLKNLFAVLVIFVASHMLFGKSPNGAPKPASLLLLLCSMVAGMLSALMGIGGGVLLVPLLLWFGVDMRKAIGTASLCGVVIALFGSFSFVIAGWSEPHFPSGALGYVYLPALLGIVFTSVFAANYGARWGQTLNVAILKKMMAGMLVIVSIRMLVGLE